MIRSAVYYEMCTIVLNLWRMQFISVLSALLKALSFVFINRQRTMWHYFLSV